MTTTLGALVTAEPAVTRLLEMRLPARVAYQVAKMARLVRVETAHFHAQRTALIQELGEERDATPEEEIQGIKGRVHGVLPAKVPEFVRRINEHGAVEVTLDVSPVPIDELGEISGADVAALGDLLAAPAP